MNNFEINALKRSIAADRKYLQGCDDDYRKELVMRIRKQGALLKKLLNGDN